MDPHVESRLLEIFGFIWLSSIETGDKNVSEAEKKLLEEAFGLMFQVLLKQSATTKHMIFILKQFEEHGWQSFSSTWSQILYCGIHQIGFTLTVSFCQLFVIRVKMASRMAFFKIFTCFGGKRKEKDQSPVSTPEETTKAPGRVRYVVDVVLEKVERCDFSTRDEKILFTKRNKHTDVQQGFTEFPVEIELAENEDISLMKGILQDFRLFWWKTKGDEGPISNLPTGEDHQGSWESEIHGGCGVPQSGAMCSLKSRNLPLNLDSLKISILLIKAI